MLLPGGNKHVRIQCIIRVYTAVDITEAISACMGVDITEGISACMGVDDEGNLTYQSSDVMHVAQQLGL